MPEPTSDIGLIGLAVMGQNLVLNIADHGYDISVYNRTTSVMETFMKHVEADQPSAERVHGHAELKDFVASIKRPRKIVLLVKSSAVLPTDKDAVDYVVEELKPLLEPGDLIIDGGNSNWNATIRREKTLAEEGFKFFGSGVSGGELGARFGPSLMPGGDPEAWKELEPIWRDIAAKVDPETGKAIERHDASCPVLLAEGEPCTAYIGPNGAGHYVKMVHNGIEYIDMQLICEAYFLMKTLLRMEPPEMSEVFTEWNSGDLDSFLIEITADILQQKDPAGQGWFVDQVLDTAGQKGTGKWTAVAALEQGIPLTLIGEAVFSRFLSALKGEREEASKILEGPSSDVEIDKEAFLKDLEQALFAAKITSYAQGYMLLGAAADEYGWNLNYPGIAQMWRGGCIIRSAFLNDIMEAYQNDENLQNLLLAPFFKEQIHEAQGAWRRVVAKAVELGIPVPASSSALAFYDGYRTARLPANLLQAQRDYFGAHTYERVDKERGEFFHTDWTGHGGDVPSGSYEA